MQGGIGDILHQEEIKELISKICLIKIEDFVSPFWFKQDQSLQKLNMQLHASAIMKNDEFILEELIFADKLTGMIYDLIATSVWKKKIWPLMKTDYSQLNSLKMYLAVYHEAVICNMLEVMFFHYTAVKQSNEYLIEIIDYCYHKIVNQINKSHQKRKRQRQNKQKGSEEEERKKKIDEIVKRTPIQEFENQIQEIEFSIFIMCVSILKYITDYVSQLQIGIVHHLIIENNIFSLLVPLIEEKPWLKEDSKGNRQIFENNKWNPIPKSEYGRLPKSEGQVWLTLYNLFGNKECMQKYELNEERKNMLLRLRKFMNEVLLDQIPALTAMLRSLQQLSMTNVPSRLTTNPFVVQQVPLLLSQIQGNKNWKQIAEEHKEKLRNSKDQTEKEHMQRLAELYSNNAVEGLVEGFKCGKCSKEAFKRCSKCKSVWYCSRDCQVSHWPDHKSTCNQKAKQLKQQEQKRKQIKIKVDEKKPTLIDQLD